MRKTDWVKYTSLLGPLVKKKLNIKIDDLSSSELKSVLDRPEIRTEEAILFGTVSQKIA